MGGIADVKAYGLLGITKVKTKIGYCKSCPYPIYLMPPETTLISFIPLSKILLRSFSWH